jgi:two-component system response regulator VicR
MLTKKILIIDDDPAILDVLKIVFQDAGYNVVISNTCKIIDDIHEIAPDLILLDVHIPTSPKNGDVICMELKANPETQKLPVILVSGETDIEQICSTCGANDYVKKPFDLDFISDKVKWSLLHY